MSHLKAARGSESKIRDAMNNKRMIYEYRASDVDVLNNYPLLKTSNTYQPISQNSQTWPMWLFFVNFATAQERESQLKERGENNRARN